MGSIQTKKIEICDITNFRPRGEIVIRKDEDFHVPVFERRTEGCIQLLFACGRKLRVKMSV